jgi:hypothetical protein
MNNTGCARPRLLLVDDTLLLSGGIHDQPQAKPRRSRGIQLWSTSAKAAGAARPGTTPDWTVDDISYYHNL